MTVYILQNSRFSARSLSQHLQVVLKNSLEPLLVAPALKVGLYRFFFDRYRYIQKITDSTGKPIPGIGPYPGRNTSFGITSSVLRDTRPRRTTFASQALSRALHCSMRIASLCLTFDYDAIAVSVFPFHYASRRVLQTTPIMPSFSVQKTPCKAVMFTKQC